MNKRLPISKELRDFVLQRDEYTCRYCGSTYGPFHLDHVYPVSKGGETTANNLVTACKHCNLSKHDKVGVWPFTIRKDRPFPFVLRCLEILFLLVLGTLEFLQVSGLFYLVMSHSGLVFVVGILSLLLLVCFALIETGWALK